MHIRNLALTAAVAACSLPALPAWGQKYDFANIADTSTYTSNIGSAPPTLNNHGKVGFVGSVFTGPSTVVSGIYTGPSPTADAVMTNANGLFLDFNLPAVNDAGTVAFWGRTSSHFGVFAGPNPFADALALTGGAYNEIPLGPIGFNNAGTAAFRARFASGVEGIFTGPNPATDTVANSAGAYSSLLRPAINNSGTVAFEATLDTGGSGIFTGPDPVANRVAVTTGAPYAALTNPDINDAAEVAFEARLDSGVRGIYTSTGRTVVDSTGEFAFLSRPRINDAGQVAFRGDSDDAGSGLYVANSASVIRKIIGRGDTLFGSAAGNLSLGELNDDGDVVFRYENDAVNGIAVAFTAHRYDGAGGAWDTATNWRYRARPADNVPTFITPENGLSVTGPFSAKTLRSLTIGAAVSGVAELRLQRSGQLTVNELLEVRTQGKLRVDGTLSALGGTVNSGEIELVNDAQMNGGSITNYGLLHGNGTVGNSVANIGRIEVIGTAGAPAQMTFTAPLTTSAEGQIVARDATVRFNGGLENVGTLGISFGTTDVFGRIENYGDVVVSGGAQATFYDDVIQNDTLRVSAAGTRTSAAVFFGRFSGTGGVTGGGDVFFEGGVSIGSSPGVVTFDADVFLGDASNTEIEIAGTATGDFDQLIINGDLSLGGTLSVVPLDGFSFQPNQLFTIFDVNGDLSGTFAGLAEGDRVGTFGGEDLFISYRGGDGNDVALSTVPEPAGIALLGVGALALCRRKRRR